MDYYLKRERKRLIDDLVDLQREEDLQKQCRTIIKSLERSKHQSDDEDEDRTHRERKKKFCLIKLTYRNPTNSHRRRDLDEIMIKHYNQTVYRACLQDGDQFAFKTRRSRNDTRLKLKFYINDVLEDEMIACCEHGLMNRNRRHHFFQINNMIEAKPCDDCESEDVDDDNNTPTRSSPIPQRLTAKLSVTKTSTPSKNQTPKKEPKEKKSTLSVPESSERKASSEGFSADINEFSQYHTPTYDRSRDADESDKDSVSSIPQLTYGRPRHADKSNKDSVSSIPPPTSYRSHNTEESGKKSESNISRPTYGRSHALQESDQDSVSSIPQRTSNRSDNADESDKDSVSSIPQPTSNRFRNADESDKASVSSIPEPTLRRTYGPPQLSTMLSRTESLDLPTPNIRESTSGDLFNSSAKTQERNEALTNSNLAQNVSQSNTYLSRQSSIIESSQTELETSLSLTNSNDIAIANDATQLILTQLGIVRQPEIDRPETSNANPPREKGNVEYFILIYLNKSNPDESIIKQLRSYVNFLKIFNDTDDCIAFVNGVIQEKIILVLDNSFRESIVSRLQGLSQIYTIHILGGNDTRIDSSLKIQGFYTDIKEIYQAVSDDINKISRDLIVYLNTSSNAVSVEPVIGYYLLLSEIILDQTETKNDIKDLVTFARQEYDGNEEELKIIDEFENIYEKKQAIYWYSRSCFISKMLNKALRIPEPDILFRMRSFIQDLFHQTKDESTTESITVYLGQTIQRSNLNDLQTNITDTDLIIFPQFLFGSTDESQAIRIAKTIPTLNNDFIPLLIRVEISDELRCVNLNSRDDDNNVLLNMGIMGRLIKIEKDNIKDDRIASIDVKLIQSSDQRNLQQTLEITRSEIKSFSPFVTMIKLMMQMKQNALAEQLIQTLFNDENLKSDANLQGSIGAACHILAQVHRNQDDYQRALNLYLISLDTFQRIISPNAVELSSLYSNIGSMYFRLENYEKSHEFYQKALEIQLHSNTPDLYSVSSFTNSIGIIYSKQGKYPEAIKSFERTLKILQQTSEPHDAELAATYDDLGDAYIAQLKFDEALNNYSKGLEIQERMESRNPQNLASSYNTIGNIYLKLGRSKEALHHLKRALECFQEVLPLTHPTLALLHNNIGLMYYREEQYDDALKYYSKTLEIAAISLPENHSLIGITLFNIGLAYSSQEKYEQAIESIEKSTKQFLKTLPDDHADIQENNKYIESIKQKQTLRNIFDES